jgi:hypothetical protein
MLAEKLYEKQTITLRIFRPIPISNQDFDPPSFLTKIFDPLCPLFGKCSETNKHLIQKIKNPNKVMFMITLS